ncbi:hypothetical protein [Tenacibaculum maritimum]|uniref:hypothetical protein n=1 Tax=Tenacibaculum maritimum TaxID=107401 RepID=UPI001330D8BE|nr:hypothetical protein [Tenacibaculum maritimum]
MRLIIAIGLGVTIIEDVLLIMASQLFIEILFRVMVWFAVREESMMVLVPPVNVVVFIEPAFIV